VRARKTDHLLATSSGAVAQDSGMVAATAG
jgi:hypothetical protein